MLSMGIDIGGSGFRIGVFDLQTGNCVGKVMSFVHEGSLSPSHVIPHIAQAILNTGWQGPIGIGFPGAVEHDRICTAPNLGEAWLTCSLRDAFAIFHHGEFAMLNDADAVALAEQHYGHGHGDHTCVLTLTIGTGLGTTVHEGGVMIPNLELGRSPHPLHDGVLESYLSGKARQEEALSIEQWCERFQIGLTYLEQEIQPTLIILYGGIMEHWAEIEPRLHANADLIPGSLPGEAGPLGAAWYAVYNSRGSGFL